MDLQPRGICTGELFKDSDSGRGGKERRGCVGAALGGDFTSEEDQTGVTGVGINVEEEQSEVTRYI